MQISRGIAGEAAAWGVNPFSIGCANHPGTGDCTPYLTDVRAIPGWLLVRRPLKFLFGRSALGTGLFSSFATMIRAASGWLTARTSAIFVNALDSTPGTAEESFDPTGSRIASGWLTMREPAGFFSAREGMDAYHRPVMPQEIAEWMQAGADKFIIDGTLGGGGHSEMFLESGARVLGIDRDPEALAHARERLVGFGDRFSTWEGNFSQLAEVPEIRRGAQADGILLDLGVSSRQLDSAVRGFSFMREGPLDMRMGPSSRFTAAQVVNEWSEAELTRILFEFGEEPKARRIASAIIRQRATRPFVTTLDLATCIEQAIGRHGRTHPATRAFQAIRMAVNEELESLATALAFVPKVLKPGGILLVITFHSLEDRMVKRFLRHRAAPFIDDPGWPEPRPNPDFQFQLPVRKALLATAEETNLNPRARSAKLRVARLLAPKP